MPYSSGRVVHDADAHIMEPPTWLRDHADPSIRDRIEPLRYSSGNELRQTGDPDEQQHDLDAAFDRIRARHASTEYQDVEENEIMLRKNFAATGSFIPDDRSRALDLLGFSSQLLFNTFHNRRLRDWEHGVDLALLIGVARAHNRGMVEFCSADDRLLPTCYVPLADLDRAAAMADEAIAMGAAALLVASGCPPTHSPSHIGLDGVLERFPDLRIGVIEQGAIWLPSWMRQMEAAFEAFARHEERLRALSLRPSEYVHRQIRATPYPTEDVGWIIEQAGPDVCLFSSDYPHVEGGRRPIERFEASLGDASDDVRQRFYADNFLDLMGTAASRFTLV